MIENTDFEMLACGFDLFGYAPVFGARLRVSAGVIVDEDNASGVAQKAILDDLARVNGCGVYRAACLRVNPNDSVFRVQVDARKDFDAFLVLHHAFHCVYHVLAAFHEFVDGISHALLSHQLNTVFRDQMRFRFYFGRVFDLR